MKSVVSMVRGSVFATVLGAMVTLSSAASARDSADPVDCVSDGWGMVTCSINGSGSSSSFLGAFASDNNGKGGWVEFYSDDDGEWWVEHHADGGTSVGWETNNIMGPKLFGSANEKAGGYDKKPRPSMKGSLKKVAKRSFAAEKAKQAPQTATMTFATSGAVTTGLGGIKFGRITVNGVGQCKAQLMVQKDGKMISNTAITASFPMKDRAVAIGNEPGTYFITVKGGEGCLNQAKTAQVTVPAVQRAPIRVAGR